jgi:phosphate transport system permease protein
VVVGTVVFGFALIASSRSWSDRVFTVSGFLATFFGLAILAIFFLRLTEEVVHWFYYTPQLVRQQNVEHLKTIEHVKAEGEKKIARMIGQVKEEVQKAASPEQKAKIRALFTAGIERAKKDLGRDIEEKTLIAERSMRDDSSSSAIVIAFMTNSASDKVQDAGIAPALLGSIWLGLITILFAVPIGVGAALYLEEYRQEGWLAKLIQININNLAGVPSVVFGILGGSVFVYLFQELHNVRPEVQTRNLMGGGLTLGLLTMPVIIVSTQEAIRAIPLSLRQGAYALGATKWQVIWTIVLPMARPGILTGTILSLSRAIGEAAPLVFMGAKMFVDRSPLPWTSFTALPLQIFNWCDRPPILFTAADGSEFPVEMWKYNAAVASTVLLLVLLSMNAVAIVLRNRAQRKMRY